MITSKVTNFPKSTVEIEITIPWEEIKTTYDKKLGDVLKEAELPGFRKGKAPQNIVEEKIDKTKLFEEVMKDIIPKAYSDAVTSNKLTPIISPKIEIVKAKEKESWIVKATVALKPEIKLKNYKEKVIEVKKAKTKIWVPGDDKTKKDDGKPSVDEIIKAIVDEVEVEISDMLVTDEANRMLANLIDQTQKLGMSIEQYVIAKGKTIEILKAEYAKQSVKNLILEFALNEIADTEKITVTQDDIDKIVSKVEKDDEKEKLRKDSYYLAHLIRQQKTLDFLANL